MHSIGIIVALMAFNWKTSGVNGVYPEKEQRLGSLSKKRASLTAFSQKDMRQ